MSIKQNFKKLEVERMCFKINLQLYNPQRN